MEGGEEEGSGPRRTLHFSGTTGECDYKTLFESLTRFRKLLVNVLGVSGAFQKNLENQKNHEKNLLRFIIYTSE